MRGKRRGGCYCRSRSARRCLQGPAEGNGVGSGGEGGRGAHIEGVVVAGRVQHVIAKSALRKKTRSEAAGRADAGQTVRKLPLPSAISTLLPSPPT